MANHFGYSKEDLLLVRIAHLWWKLNKYFVAWGGSYGLSNALNILYIAGKRNVIKVMFGSPKKNKEKKYLTNEFLFVRFYYKKIYKKWNIIKIYVF